MTGQRGTETGDGPLFAGVCHLPDIGIPAGVLAELGVRGAPSFAAGASLRLH